MVSATNVFLYIPNLIGYIRICLSFYSFSLAFTDYKSSVILYTASFVCDYFDGLFARALRQCSTFGAVLDMITDRCSTLGLLFILAHLYPSQRLLFLFLSLLDLSSHWLHMYSVKGHHKSYVNQRNIILQLYYGCYPIFGFCCVGTECFYILLYVSASDPYIQFPLQNECYYAGLTACLMKNVINMVQLSSAANAIAEEDARVASLAAESNTLSNSSAVTTLVLLELLKTLMMAGIYFLQIFYASLSRLADRFDDYFVECNCERSRIHDASPPSYASEKKYTCRGLHSEQ